MSNKDYNEDSIRVLQDIEHVRLRPAMYVKSERPQYQMFTEICDNGTDEIMNGFGDTVKLNIDYINNIIEVEDNGRGIPQGLNQDLQKPTPIVIYTKLNSGGKYDTKAYNTSSGLHGVGSTVVNALSEWMKIETWRDGSLFKAEFTRGEVVSYTQEPTKVKGSGTKVIFKPDDAHLDMADFMELKIADFKTEIENRLALLVSIVPKMKIIYNGQQVTSKNFGEFIAPFSTPLFDNPVVLETKNLKVAVNWSTDTNKSSHTAYCNSLYNPQGGDHERAVYEGLVEVFKTDDVYLGCNIAVSVLFPEVQYDSQAKLKANSKDMRQFVKDKTIQLMKDYLKQNPGIGDKILELAKKKRDDLNKRNNKSNVARNRKSSFLNALSVAGFSDCTTKDRSEAQMYIVEGESAAGSARQARDVKTQAILPLRGKVINAYTNDVKALLNNAEIATIVSNIDAGIFEEINVARSRYDEIIIMTDADEDGKNIACQLISFFIFAMTDLVKAGKVYLALPPLFGVTVNGKFIPLRTEQERDDYVAKGHKVTRFKGLGEMNASQLKVACMDMATRELIQLQYNDETAKLVQYVMGGDSTSRKELLKKCGALV